MSGCAFWLLDYLYFHGPSLTGDVRSAAKEKGYTRAELKNARKEAGVKTYHSFDDVIDVWYWHLPNQKVRNQQ